MAGDTNVVTVSVSYLKELEAYKEAYIRLNGVPLVFQAFYHTPETETLPKIGDKWFKYPPAEEAHGSND